MNILDEFDLTEQEQNVYLALLKVGAGGVAAVARVAGKPRQTVYSTLQNLVQMEFVEQGQGKYARKFSADPNKLLYLLDKQKDKLEKRRQKVERELPALAALRARVAPYPKVQYYESEEGLARLLDDTLTVLNKTKEKEFRGYGLNEYKEKLEEVLPEYIVKRAKAGIHTRILIGKGPDYFQFDTSKKYKRDVRHINIKSPQAGLYVAGSTVYFFSYADSVGVKIENEAMASLIKEIFDDHWVRIPEK